MSEKAPFVHVVRENVPGMATAGTDDTIILSEVPFAGTVTSVTYTPDAAITGAATNHRAVRLINRGAAGTGTTVIAELAFDNGVNAVAGDELTIPLSAVAGATTVAAGDILSWFSDAILTGIADPGGLVQVEISRS
jgi:hypothetical protein